MTESPNNHEIYEANWAEWVDMKVYGPASRWLRFLIGNVLDRIPADFAVRSILDVGCGEGTITNSLAMRYPDARVVGIDFSATGIACAVANYQRSNLEFRHDLSSKTLGEDFDLVTAFEVLEHVEDWRDLLGRMTEASRKFVLLSFPTGRMRPFEQTVGHLRNFEKGEVENFLAARGFAGVAVNYAGFPFYSPIYRELCNLTNAGGNSFTRGRYGLRQRAMAEIFYRAFRHFSSRRRGGDQFCGLFGKSQGPARFAPTGAIL